MNLQFLGATRTVTGSKYLIKADNKNILVDCGLFQGYKDLRLRNWERLPINPRDIDCVLLTHAHIDHSGYIPLLVKNGFRGPIFCSEATRDLCEVLLPDSGHIHEEDARYANRKGFSKHHPALPLYTEQEARKSLDYFHTINFEEKQKLDDDLHFTFHYGGHILGASLITVQHYDIRLLFTGDLGRAHDPIMHPPVAPPPAEYLVVESTYGNRLHENVDPQQQLQDIINSTVKTGGTIVIPAFAVGRAQDILYFIYKLKQNKAIPDIPVYIDSPMATSATRLFYKYSKEHRLSKSESEAVCKTAKYIRTVDESIELDTKNMPIIIISASGMATGGRVLHHIKRFAPDHKNAIVFCGYQAGGTRGARLLAGEKEIKMFGQAIPIRAHIYSLENTSAHVDYNGMLRWLGQIKKPPRHVFITHGEDEAAQALKDKIEERFRWTCTVPNYLDEIELI